jgi:hypothetical protein
VVLEGRDLLLEQVHTNLVVLDDAAAQTDTDRRTSELGVRHANKSAQAMHNPRKAEHEMQRRYDILDLKLLDAVADGDKLGGSPQKAIHLNGAHKLFHLGHVSLVIPWLDVEQDTGLGNHNVALGSLGSLALVVGSDTLGLDALSLLVDLIVITEQVIVVV